MHISDGVMTETLVGQAILVGGSMLALAGTAVGLKKMDYERIPRVGVLASAFFVASLIHLKFGPTSVHLVLNGLVGLILGWAAFPAFLIALFLQAVFFGHGGITTLGLNSFNFGFTALLVFYIFNRPIRRIKKKWAVPLLGFMAGLLAPALSALLVAVELFAIGEAFEYVAWTVLFAHLPIAVVEGFVTSAAVLFFRQVRPELLESPYIVVKENTYV
jgi:cobalt/nickel transport system permease protein